MVLHCFIVDSFTRRPFAGNPAAVCLLNKELSEIEYQRIAAEFNLSETAFVLPFPQTDTIGPKNAEEMFQKDASFSLRWFTPAREVPLCGHATLAAAHVLFHEIGNSNDSLRFATLSGDLVVRKEKEDKGQHATANSATYAMDFPAYQVCILELEASDGGKGNGILGQFPKMLDTQRIGTRISDLIAGSGRCLHLAIAPEAKKLIVVLDPNTTKADFLSIRPDPQQLLAIDPCGKFVRGAIVTYAPKDSVKQGFEGTPHYVSRYFAPWVGISEDPATGSSQCALAPFWSKALNKPGPFQAQQCFPGRGAEFHVELAPDGRRVNIRGSAVTVLKGTLLV